MRNKKAFVLMIVSFFISADSCKADSLLKKVKSKATAIGKGVKSTVKTSITEVKTAAAKDKQSIKVVIKDVKQGKLSQATKDSGKVVVNSLNVVKAVPLVGTVVKDGETAVSSAKKVNKDIKQIKQDAKTMGLKKALKKDGKKLAKDSWSTVSNAASAIGTPAMFASGMGFGAEALAMAGQAGFLAKGAESIVRDSKTLVTDYKKDKNDPTVSGKHRALDIFKNGLMVGGDVLGIASMGSIGLSHGMGRGALKELGVARAELEPAKQLVTLQAKKVLTNAEQKELSGLLLAKNNTAAQLKAKATKASEELKILNSKSALSSAEKEQKAKLQQLVKDVNKPKLSNKTINSLENADPKAIAKIDAKIKFGEKISSKTNVLFGTQFASQDISTTIGQGQYLAADKKQLKQDKAQLAMLEKTGGSAEEIAELKKYIQQDKDYINRDKAGMAGATIKVIGDTQQNNIALQSALLMGGSAVSDSAALQQAKRDLDKAVKQAKQTGASDQDIQKLKDAYEANKKILMGNAVGSLFHQNMAITMTAQEIGSSIAKVGYTKLDNIAAKEAKQAETPVIEQNAEKEAKPKV